MTMQNKPQLSAEVERRFNTKFVEVWLKADHIGVEVGDELKHFLAVTLEEQEKQTLKKVYKIIMENGSADRSSILHKLARIIQQEEKLC